MPVEVVPALRDLVAIPRTMERFDAYVRAIIGPDNVVELIANAGPYGIQAKAYR